MKIGIVGKPSSGKSTFFKAATLLDVKISPVPFTTIEPNIGIGFVRVECVEKEFGVRCNAKTGYCLNGYRFIPIKLIDVAGLVPDAHKGRGLGNKFLDDLRNADCLIHVVDFSGLTDEEGKPTEGHDPMQDIEFLAREIDEWFKSLVEKALGKYLSMIKKGMASKPEEIITQQLSGLGIKKKHVMQAMQEVGIADVERFAKRLREISKPILIAANKIDLPEAKRNFERLKNKVNAVPVSSEAEVALKLAAKKGLIDYIPGSNDFEIKGSLTKEQEEALEKIRREVLKPYGSTGVQTCLNKAVFELLNYIVVYPVANESKLSDKEGNVLPDAYLIPKGTTIKEFAELIHSDLAKGFIAGIEVRSKKRLAKDYEINNNDVIKIVFK